MVIATSDAGESTLAAASDGQPTVSVWGGYPLLVVPGWDLRSADAARLGAPSPDGAVWAEPVDAARVDVDGTPVVVMALADGPDGPPLVGEAVGDDVIPAQPVPSTGAAAGLRVEGIRFEDPDVSDGSWDVLVGSAEDLTVTRDGVRLVPTAEQPAHGWSFRDTDGSTLVLLPQAGTVGSDHVVVSSPDGSLRVANENVAGAGLVVGTDQRAVDVLVVDVDHPDPVVAVLALINEPNAVNQWVVQGASDVVHVALDGGTVTIDPDGGLWLLAPEDGGAPRAGRVGEAVLAVPAGRGKALTALVADAKTVGQAQLVLVGGANAAEGGTARRGDRPGTPQARFEHVTLGSDGDLADQILGADTDGDGKVDIRFQP